MDYGKALLSGNVPKEENIPKKVDYGKLILDPSAKIDVKNEFVDTEEISTITGKPVQEFTGEGGKGAGFVSHFKAGFVDDPVTKAKIYAEDRFPDLTEEERLSRYKIYKGDIIYKDENGDWKRESPNSPIHKLISFTADTAAHSPAIVGAMGGEILGGTAGMAVGAMGGEAVRKVIGNKVFDEPQSVLDYMIDMGIEGAVSGVGKLAAKGGVAGINKLRSVGAGKTGRNVAKAAGRDLPTIDARDAERVYQIGKKYGIDLPTPATTDSQRLKSTYNLLGDLPDTADKIAKNRESVASQVELSIQNFLDKYISTSANDPMISGRKLTEAAKKAVRRPVDVRRTKAAPIYKKAFDSNPEVDIKPVVDIIDEDLKTAKGIVRSHLLTAKKALMNPDLPKETPASTILSPSGSPATPAKKSFDTTLKGLHDAKTTIDEYIAAAKRQNKGKIVSNYMKIKSALLNQMDEASPDYKRARQVFSDFSEEVNKQSGKTRVGSISRLQDDQMVKATQNLFSTVGNSPELMLKARTQIVKESPEAWNEGLRTFIEEKISSLKPRRTGGNMNYGGYWYQELFGNPKQRKILQAAMKPDQYEAFKEFSNIMKRAGSLFGAESTTAPRQEALRQMKKQSQSEMLISVASPLRTPERVVAEKYNQLRFERHAKNIADAMLDPDAHKMLSKIKHLSPASEEYAKQAGIFLSLVSSGYFSNEMQDDTVDKIE